MYVGRSPLFTDGGRGLELEGRGRDSLRSAFCVFSHPLEGDGVRREKLLRQLAQRLHLRLPHGPVRALSEWATCRVNSDGRDDGQQG